MFPFDCPWGPEKWEDCPECGEVEEFNYDAQVCSRCGYSYYEFLKPQKKGGESMTVNFKFEPKTKVKTALDDTGIISFAAVNKSGEKQYYVQLKEGNGDWFYEDQLTATA